LEQRNKAFSDTKKHQVGDSSKWWFDNIHPDSIKMSIKLYSFIEQKTTIGKMNTALNVLTTL
jgi:hypothetical protein